MEGQLLNIALECQNRADGSLDLRGFVNGQKLLEANDPDPHPPGAVWIIGGMNPWSRNQLGGFRPFTIEWDRFRIGGL